MSQKDYIIRRRFEELFRNHFVALCYFADKYTPDTDISKEVVHNVFLNIWEKRDNFDFDKPAKSYLFTAVYNRCMNYIRDSKKFTNAEDENGQFIHDSGNFEDTMETAELEKKITDAIDKLPEKCREVFKLSRFNEMKYSQIAKKLEISVKTVEVQVSKALKILRNELSDYLMLILLFLFY